MRGEKCPTCGKIKREIVHIEHNRARSYICVACGRAIDVGDADKWFSCSVNDGALPDATTPSGVSYAMFHENCQITIPLICLCDEETRQAQLRSRYS